MKFRIEYTLEIGQAMMDQLRSKTMGQEKMTNAEVVQEIVGDELVFPDDLAGCVRAFSATQTDPVKIKKTRSKKR